MKKRILALTLCLVLATSLLPLTAAAEEITVNEAIITANDVKPNTDGTYGVNITSLKLNCADGKKIDAIASGYTIGSQFQGNSTNNKPIKIPPVSGVPYRLVIVVVLPDSLKLPNTEFPTEFTFTSNAHKVLESSGAALDNKLAFKIELQIDGEHVWDIRKPDSGTLTADCQDSDCAFKGIGVNLTAHSVTLPESPFNAEVQVVGAFEKAFPNADIGPLVYKYKGPGDSEYREIKPNAANAKAGEYQVGVQITGLPISPAAIAARGNQDNAGFADLYVQYTAVDPAITAQTGDNRPIELMLAGLVVFAALAAAAFALDNKRKYSR